MMGPITTLLLLSSFAFGQTSIGTYLPALESVNPEAYQCTSEDFRNCARSLCGENSNYQDRNEAVYEQLYDSKAFGSIDSVKSRLKLVLESQRKRNLEFIKEMRLKILAGEFAVTTSDWHAEDWEREAEKAFKPFLEWVIDKSKPIDEKISIKLTGIEGQTPQFKEALRIYADERAKSLSVPRTLIENKLFQPQELQKFISESRKSLGDEKIPSDVLAQLDKGDDPYSAAWSLHLLLPKQPESYACQSPKCRNALSRHLGNELVPLLDKFQAENERPDFIESHLPRCVSSFIQAAVQAPESEAMISSMPDIRKRFMEKGLSSLSEHSRQTFSAYLDEKVEHITGLPQNPRNSLVTSEQEVSRPHTLEGGDTLLKSFNTYKDHFDPVLGIEACKRREMIETDHFRLNPMTTISRSDGTVRVIGDPEGKDRIQLRAFSCTHPDLGEGVYAHELGHALSFFIRNEGISKESMKVFLDVRACLAERGVGEAPAGKGFEMDRMTTEEDQADFYSFLATKGNPHLYNCKAVDIHSLESQSAMSPNDEHSPPFVRLMREARVKEIPLPDACVRVFQQHSAKLGVEACLP